MRATSVVVVGMIRTLQIIEDILLILAFHSCISSFGIHPSIHHFVLGINRSSHGTFDKLEREVEPTLTSCSHFVFVSIFQSIGCKLQIGLF